MSVSIILYVIAAFAGVLGVLVFLRNTASKSHRLFLSLSLGIGLWIVSNAIFAQATDGQDYPVALAAYAFAAATAVSFFFFVANLSDTKLPAERWLKMLS